VLVHGGGWVAGSPELLADWATELAGRGAVVFNASYRTLFAGGGYPQTIDDVACAVRYARATATAFTSSKELVIVGHSAGGHLAAVVALNGDAFGGDCAFPRAALPDRLVGLAGVYDIRDFEQVETLLRAAGLTADEWSSINPVELAAQRPELAVTLVVGEDDAVVPRGQADEFASALETSASRSPGSVQVVTVPGATHNDLQHPSVVDPALVGF
jgi:acetyl esterase/lipase